MDWASNTRGIQCRMLVYFRKGSPTEKLERKRWLSHLCSDLFFFCDITIKTASLASWMADDGIKEDSGPDGSGRPSDDRMKITIHAINVASYT